MFEDIMLMDVNIVVWIVMFTSMFLASVACVWQPWKNANAKKEASGEAQEAFWKPYLYAFLANVMVVLTFMAAAMEMIKEWELSAYLEPTLSSLIVTFIASFIAVVILQDTMKVFLKSYQEKLKASGKWYETVIKDIADEIKDQIS